MSNDTFYIDQPVRVSDLNYGNHVGITQMHAMAHNARYCFLSFIGLSELDIGGPGIMALESNIKLSGECFLGDQLRFFVDIKILSKTQFKCIVTVFSLQKDKTIATIDEKMICFDYSRKRPAAIPESFASLFQGELRL